MRALLHWRADLAASLVVFLVAVPLSLGIALASGAPIMSGLVAAGVGGIVVGLLGGAPFQVSGPAAGLTVLVFGLIQQFGWAVTCAVTVMAGLLQILLGKARVARTALAISPAVVHGMLAGIGIVITLAQLHVVLGGTPQSSALKNLKALPQQLLDQHGPSVLLGLLTIAVLLVWPKRLQRIPSALVAILFSTVVSLVFAMPVKTIDLPDHLLAGHIFPQLPPAGQWGAFVVAVISVALIASVESLLSAVATDRLHDGTKADLDRELLGQGTANLLSGILGGLPVTGVIVRSSANIKAGARTRLSAILHGVWIVLFVTLLSAVIDDIPLAALAGLLMVVGLRLVNIEHLRDLSNHRELPVYVVTMLGVVLINLLAGVALGCGVAVFMLLRRLATVKVRVTERKMRWHVRIEGSLTFLSVPTLSRALANVPAGADVDVDLMVDLMDHAAFEALHSWKLSQERQGGRIDIDERHELWYQEAANGVPRQAKSSPMAAVATLLTGRNRSEGLEEGLKDFMQTGALTLGPMFKRLAQEGQKPETLFITCSDSRVVPNLLTLSGPGDLFQLRNIGNLVPRRGTSPDSSVAAAIEYALNQLNVKRIVVCGHSGCGAMAGLLQRKHPEPSGLSSWLAGGRESLERFDRGKCPCGHPTNQQDQLSQVNVICQIEHLLSYPEVRERHQAGRLELTGMYFDIERSQLHLLDGERGLFAPVEADMLTRSEAVLVGVGR